MAIISEQNIFFIRLYSWKSSSWNWLDWTCFWQSLLNSFRQTLDWTAHKNAKIHLKLEKKHPEKSYFQFDWFDFQSILLQSSNALTEGGRFSKTVWWENVKRDKFEKIQFETLKRMNYDLILLHFWTLFSNPIVDTENHNKLDNIL